MSLKDALFEHLRADASITAIVGSGDSAKIYPMVAPASAALPYITYQQLSAVNVRHMTAAAGLIQVRMQVDSWHDNPIDADTLSEAVRQRLDGFTGAMGPDDFPVWRVSLENFEDDFEESRKAGEVELHRVSQDYFMWYSTSVPTF